MNDTPPPPNDPVQPPPSRRAWVLLGLGGLVTFGALVAAGVAFAVRGHHGEAQTGFLEVHLDETMADAPGDAGLTLDPGDFPPLVTETAAALRRAAADPKVTGLYLEVGGTGLGWAGTQELRDAVTAFTASGKPCHAWAQELDNKGYYLASACDQIHLAPAGLMLVNGLAVTHAYYAGTLEKVGVKANFEHVGDYKSAVEPFTRAGPSDAASEATEGLLGNLWDQVVDGIAAGRSIDAERVRALVDDPPMTPQAALEGGWVDALSYRDQVREEKAGPERLELGDYVRDAPSGTRTVAVVHAEGQIVSGESDSPLFGGTMIGDESFIEILDDVREDEEVAAVVLRVNSPGGSGLASDNIWHAVERLKAAGKPVVVSMGDYAASGGYYIAAGADRIVAEPGTLTGSIGVFGGKMNVAGLYDKLGITLHTWQRGAVAGLLSPTSDFSELERAKFRAFLEGFYETFLTRVAEGRGMQRDAVHAVAQGRVWTGAQALDRKLVDELGGLDVAIARARELAKIPADESLTLRRLPERRTLFEQLLADVEGKGGARLAVDPMAMDPALRDAVGGFVALSRVLDHGGVAAMLPGRLHID
ncbi:MAG: signal peptide peptidase SppA [Pseudomonadota bacterium]|jgi:protease-4